MIDIVNCFIVHRHTNIWNRHMCAKIHFRWHYYPSLFVFSLKNNWCDFNATMKLIDNKSSPRSLGNFAALTKSVLELLSLFRVNPEWKENKKGEKIQFSMMSSYLNLFASSMNGRFCISVSNFHSAPNLLLISRGKWIVDGESVTSIVAFYSYPNCAFSDSPLPFSAADLDSTPWTHSLGALCGTNFDPLSRDVIASSRKLSFLLDLILIF